MCHISKLLINRKQVDDSKELKELLDERDRELQSTKNGHKVNI